MESALEFHNCRTGEALTHMLALRVRRKVSTELPGHLLDPFTSRNVS